MSPELATGVLYWNVDGANAHPAFSSEFTVRTMVASESRATNSCSLTTGTAGHTPRLKAGA